MSHSGYTYTTPDAHPLIPASPPRRLLVGLTAAQRDQAHRDHRRQWLDLHTEGVGASNASTILEVNPHASLTQLYAQKTTDYTLTETDQMRMGREDEPRIRARWVQETGIPTRRVGMLANTEQPWMRCTPDYLTGDGAGLECKSTTERSADHWDEHPSDHALAQAQWSMAVTGLTRWHVAVLFRDSGRFVRYEVQRDDGLIDILVQRASAFWHGNVLQRCAPPLDGSEATRDAVRALYPHTTPGKTVDGGEQAAQIRRRLARITEQKKALEAEERAARAELTALADNAETVTADSQHTEVDPTGQRVTIKANGVKVATLKRNGTFPSAQYAKAHPERAEQYMTTVSKLDARRALAEDPEAAAFVPRVLRLSNPDWATPWTFPRPGARQDATQPTPEPAAA